MSVIRWSVVGLVCAVFGAIGPNEILARVDAAAAGFLVTILLFATRQERAR